MNLTVEIVDSELETQCTNMANYLMVIRTQQRGLKDQLIDRRSKMNELISDLGQVSNPQGTNYKRASQANQKKRPEDKENAGLAESIFATASPRRR